MAKRGRSPKMTAKRRRSLPKKKFGLPGSRKYPMDTRGRAANAKARATQQYKRGRLSKSARDRIHAKANRILGKKKSSKRRKR
jgi:hypothetical protein